MNKEFGLRYLRNNLAKKSLKLWCLFLAVFFIFSNVAEPEEIKKVNWEADNAKVTGEEPDDYRKFLKHEVSRSEFKLEKEKEGLLEESIEDNSILLEVKKKKTTEISKIVATVNKEVITSKDLNDYRKFLKYRSSQLNFTPEIEKEILDKLIEDKLILSQAKKQKIEVPKEWLEEKLRGLILSYPSQKEFETSLVKEGLTLNLLKEKLKNQYLMQNVIDKYVRSSISISPQTITNFYDNQTINFFHPRKYAIWMLKSKDRAVLQELRKQIKGYGMDSLDKDKYGIVRIEVEDEDLKEEIRDIVIRLKEGESMIKELSGLYYLVYLEKNISPRQVPLEEAGEGIHLYLWQQKFEKAFTEWLDNLKAEAIIKIYE